MQHRVARRDEETEAAPPARDDDPGAEALYLDLLMKCLTRSIFPDATLAPSGGTVPVDPSARAEGRDWPAQAETMIGLERLGQLRDCVVDVIRRGVPGDLIETGVWRGGATIFMRGVLKAYGDRTRVVWVADSFQGLPQPDAEEYPADAGDPHWQYPQLAVSLDEVKANFARYGLLDEQVRFLPGWFRDTLPAAPIERLAVLRLDGDLYESTIVALQSLYPKLSPGGYAVVDDYSLPACRAAVDDYRAEHGISEPIERIDWTGVFWRRRSAA